MAVARSGYLKKRLLKLQVGFLLTEGPGNSKEVPISLPQRVQVDSDLFLESLAGGLILTRTKEGILIQGNLHVMHARECDRCLEAFNHGFVLSIAELFASPPDANISAFSVDSNGEIDLAPLLREEVLIEESYRTFCREDCRGLSAQTGINLNYEREATAAEAMRLEDGAAIDPRLAVLKQLLK
ncbi:MAG: DUF177 domain-containing protein [Chloroflexota bacterium]|nr:DUF177 domain-containing protein [Chloroflexota bacterium]MDE2852933.1 DUF177 domain-containing protein [Chloroflexota bacterium]MDE2948638.1 DUF177 domain-containing protein [Chloroflexota bacterium]